MTVNTSRADCLAVAAAERAERFRYWQPTRSFDSYEAAHRALYRLRGSARWQVCVDCGEQAKDWSYDGGAPDQRPDDRGPYSSDLRRYSPRCARCHARHDRPSAHQVRTP